jgi:hypothetical protein
MKDHQKIFAERLARIAAQTGNTNATLHIGMESQVPNAMTLALRNPKLARAMEAAVQGLSPRSVPLALFSGAAAMVAGHLARVWMFGQGQGMSGVLFDLSAAMLVIVVLRGLLGLRGPGALALQLVGAAIVAGGLHNAVHQWPQIFAAVFPPSWTTAVLEATQPMTVSLGMLAL